MPKSASESRTPRSSTDGVRSGYVPEFRSDADREAFRNELLNEWSLMHKLGELRPASGQEHR